MNGICFRFCATPCRGRLVVDPKLPQMSCPLNGTSFPIRTVGAATSRPQHKALLRSALAGATYSSTPTVACTFTWVLPEIRGFGQMLSAPTGRSSTAVETSSIQQHGNPRYHILAILKRKPVFLQKRNHVDALAFHTGVHPFRVAAGETV